MKHMLTKMLAFCLSAALFLSGVTPAYAAQMDNADLQTLELDDTTTLSSPTLSSPTLSSPTLSSPSVDDGEEDEDDDITNDNLPTIVWDYDGWVSITIPDAYSNIISWLVNEDGEKCSTEWNYMESYTGPLADYVSGMWDASTESGTYYLAVCAQDEIENRTETVVCAIPIYFTNETVSGNAVIESGNLSDRYYFKDFPSEEYESLEITFGYENDGFECRNWYNTALGYYCVDQYQVTEWENDGYSIVKLRGYDSSYTEQDVSVKMKTAAQFVESPFEEVDTFEEPQLSAPILSMDGEKILVQNTEEDRGVDIYVGLVSKEAYESGEYNCSAKHSLEVDAADYRYEYLEQMLAYEGNVEPGIYYCFAYARNQSGGVDSKPAVLNVNGNPYPIVVSKFEKTNPIEYQNGQYRENHGYFNGYTAEEYPWVYLIVDFVIDYGENGEIDSFDSEEKRLFTIDGTYYFNKKAYDEDIQEGTEYKSWAIKELLLNKVNITEEKCEWNITAANVAESTEKYPEKKVSEPKISINQNSDGEYVIYLENTWNDDVDLILGLCSETENVSETSRWSSAGETMEFSIDELFQGGSIEAGTYSLCAYASGWNNEIDSEKVVLDNYPIIVTDNTLDTSIAYKHIEESNNIYFADAPAGDYDLVKLYWTEIYSEDYQEPASRSLSKKVDYYYLSFYDIYSENYSFDKLALSQFDMGLDKCTVTRDVCTSFVEREDIKEPKPDAPSIELYEKDGKVVGVVVENKNLTFDDEKDRVLFGYFGKDRYGEDCIGEFWEGHLAYGEKQIVYFKDMYVPVEFTEDQTWQFGAYVRSFDSVNEEYVSSDYTYLDYGIEGKEVQYSEDEISIYEEYVSEEDDGDIEEYVGVHVPIEDIPKNSIASVVYFTDVDYDDEEFESWVYLYENDESEKYATGRIWNRYVNITENITKARFITSAEYGDSGLVVTYTEVPKEKITVEDISDNDKPVFLLDYDHYQAFIASGGKVTCENGELFLSDDQSWTLKVFENIFKGSEIIQSIKEIGRDILKEANQYWEGFVAKHFYDVNGKEISKDAIEDHDIVLVKYEPEVVWIESIKLSAPGHVKVGETVTIGATPVYQNNGYERDVPAQFRFKVSDPSIAKIDPVTGKLTGLKNGTVTVTVIADEALREQHGSLERVLTSAKVTVGHIHYEKYTKTTVKAPTCTKAGSEKWTCADCPDKLTKTVTLKKLGHNVSAKVTTKATTSANGKITETCKRCKKVVDTDPIYKIKSVKLSKTSYTYDGEVKKPTVTVKDSKGKVLTLNTDYTVSYAKGRKNVGTYKVTVKFKGKYSGTETETFKINAKKITSSMIADIADRTYNGKAQKPSVTVKYGDITLKNKTNYTVAYKNNTNAGTASVTVTGKGNYTGSATVKFTIERKSIEGFKLSKVATQTYTGKSLKPTVTVKNGSKKLVSGTDYKVSYSKNKNTGIATVKVTGKGNYSGSLKTTFVIKPKQATLKTLKTTATGSMTVKWAKDTQATGYIVEYSTSKKFPSSKTTKLVITTNTDVSEKIKGLKSKKTYYVRVTSYKTINEKNYNGKASAVKSVKVK